jgi:hypothetical protein
MKKPKQIARNFTCILAAAALGWAASAQASLLVSFPFNEGSGSNTTDTVTGLEGYFGYRQDPALNTVELSAFSPSGLPGDGSISTSGGGFLMVDDSNSPVLAITNGPITIETWLYIDPNSTVKPSEGLMGYGNSYKLGMINGRLVFTLFGIVDLSNAAPEGILPAGQWTHVAAAWNPGEGVYFYINGVSNFFVAHAATAARPPWHNYLSIGAESQVRNTLGSMDRVRVHNALLTADNLDSDPANPRAPLAGTVVAYNFNETAFPSQSAVAPSRPTLFSHEVTHKIGAPVWTTDTPTGLPGDYALSFNATNAAFRERVTVEYEGEMIPLGQNNTNYTLEAWVKLPTAMINDRMVIFRGPTNAPRVSLSVAANRTMHTTLLGNADFASTVQIPNDNRWHHLAVVMEDFARVHFYLDGTLRQTMNRTATGNPNANAAAPNLLIGQESETRYYKGLLDRVRIHNSALTSATLDYPAIPGMAVVTAQPDNVSSAAGGSAVFSAEVTSPTAAAYQWRYRRNITDVDSVPVPGANSTTLTLSDLAAKDEGYYFLAITNAAGVSESYGARLMVNTGPSFETGFELPNYVSGPLEGQDFWLNDQHGNVVNVRTAEQIAAELAATGRAVGQTVRSGSQALLITGPSLATASVRPVVGFENQDKVNLTVWVRPLGAGTSGNAIGNTFVTVENSAGTRAAAFRFGGSFGIDYNSANLWVPTGLTWNEDTWYEFTMQLDYSADTYDLLIDGVKVNANPLPFYVAASDRFEQIRIYRGANNAGAILDDLKVVSAVVAELRITDIGITGSTVNIQWQGGQPPYQLQRRADAASGEWENVGTATTQTQASDTVGASKMFYRILGN